VAALRFSRRAEADVLSIVDYTLRTWGEDQAIRYAGDLEACCEMLAANPALGRMNDYVRLGLRRMECGRHVVFYWQEPQGILVSRVLHRSMLPENQDFGDQREAQ
jgi:toxin ParE1/3/4